MSRRFTGCKRPVEIDFTDNFLSLTFIAQTTVVARKSTLWRRAYQQLKDTQLLYGRKTAVDL